MEIEHFCTICGKKLFTNPDCVYCTNEDRKREYKYKGHFLENTLTKNEGWTERNKQYYAANSQNIRLIYLCHNCQYYMFHQLSYCYKCSGRFYPLRLTNQELVDKYGHYKQGY